MIAEVPTARALAMHKASYAFSKHQGLNRPYVSPYEAAQEAGELSRGFVRVIIPVRHLDAERAGHNEARIARYAEALKKRPALYGPAWGSFNGRSQRRVESGRDVLARPIYVRDGNHRTIGQMDNGAAYVEVMLPRSHFDAYQRLYRGK